MQKEKEKAESLGRNWVAKGPEDVYKQFADPNAQAHDEAMEKERNKELGRFLKQAGAQNKNKPSFQRLTKKDIIRTAENQSRISALVKHKQQQKVFLLLGSFSLSL